MDNSKIKVGILGIGNCASSLVQGLEYYKVNDTENGLSPDGTRPITFPPDFNTLVNSPSI